MSSPSLSRRYLLQAGVLTGISAALPFALPAAERTRSLITKAIPSTGQKIPVIGLGTNHFGGIDYSLVRDNLKRMHELGGTVIDTSSDYGDSEAKVGKALDELGLTRKMFITTKFNALGVGKMEGFDPVGSKRDTLRGMESVERSLNRLGKVDLMFVHQLDSVEPIMPLLQDLKKQGRVRYIGITSVGKPEDNPRVARYLRNYPLDFVQVSYNLEDRSVEQEVLPLAQERRIAVSAAVPVGGSVVVGHSGNLLLAKVGNRQLPNWAADFDIKSWSQFFLKYVVSHPAVTCAVPGSTSLEHLEDNQAADHGRLPDAKTRKKMEQFWDNRI